jgi:hypothetical protein
MGKQNMDFYVGSTLNLYNLLLVTLPSKEHMVLS